MMSLLLYIALLIVSRTCLELSLLFISKGYPLSIPVFMKQY
jgi:hypothetical protein